LQAAKAERLPEQLAVCRRLPEMHEQRSRAAAKEQLFLESTSASCFKILSSVLSFKKKKHQKLLKESRETGVKDFTCCQ